MANVSMSLNEYNEMRDELLLYKRVIQELTTPHVDEWSVNWYMEHPSSSLDVVGISLENMSQDVRQFITPIIQNRIQNFYAGLEGNYVIENFRIHFGTIYHNEEPAQEEAEDTPESV